MLAVLLYLTITAESMAQENLQFKNFLQATLDKIQKERLESSGELNQKDFESDFDGEIIIESEDGGLENSDNKYEPHFIDVNSVNSDETATSMSIQIQNPGEMEATDIKGYYYYYYPLNHYLENYMDKEPNKDSDEMSFMMETMTNSTMMQKQETRVTPLFKAVTWFIGTAMVFVMSILLMPRFKVKKAKEIIKSGNWDGSDSFPIHSIFNKYINEQLIFERKNKL